MRASVIAGLLMASGCLNAAEVMKVCGEREKTLLLSDGRVLYWSAAGKQLVTAALPGKAVDIAVGEEGREAFAVLEDGAVVTWPGAGGDVKRVPSLSEMKSVESYGGTTVALRSDGTVWAWGTRGTGLVGDGKKPEVWGESGPRADYPVKVPGVDSVIQISVRSHALALRSDGTVYSWGSNHYGALGRAPRQELPIDRVGMVDGISDVIAVAAGSGVSTAVRRDGTVWVWGANWHAQFGNGKRTDPPGPTHGYDLKPQPVLGVANVVAISLGHTGRHTLALLKDGTLRGWGNTDWGQIGAGAAAMFQERPVVPKISGVKRVMAAGNNSFAVKTDGSLWVWGIGRAGQWPLQAITKLPQPLVLDAER